MAAKKVWVTWMPAGEGANKPDPILKALDAYGLQISGAPWVDDLEKMAWYEIGTTLLEQNKADLWLIAGTQSDLEPIRHRYALSLVTAMVREGRGISFPIFCLGLDHTPNVAAMPTLTRDLYFLSATDAGWTSKILAAFAKKTKTNLGDSRFSAVGHPFIGQWFEVGPREGEWPGVMFGVSGEGNILHAMVGPKGQLPEKSTLEYPTHGIKAEINGVAYTACSVQNRIGMNDSYYVKVEGFPHKIFWGGPPGDNQGDVTLIQLC